MTTLPRQLFVTGTDTGVGKTMVCALLTLAFKAAYWKPIQSGILEPGDTETIAALTGLPSEHFLTERYRLTQPLSPHASAAIDRVNISLNDFVLPATNNERLIVEGAGGVLVPLNERHLVLDLIRHLNLPALVVARSGLGTINHTLLTLNALRANGVLIVGVIMNGAPNPGNRQAIEHYGRTRVLAEVPPLPHPLTREHLLQAAQVLHEQLSNLASVHSDENSGQAAACQPR